MKSRKLKNNRLSITLYNDDTNIMCGRLLGLLNKTQFHNLMSGKKYLARKLGDCESRNIKDVGRDTSYMNERLAMVIDVDDFTKDILVTAKIIDLDLAYNSTSPELHVLCEDNTFLTIENM